MEKFNRRGFLRSLLAAPTLPLLGKIPPSIAPQQTASAAAKFVGYGGGFNSTVTAAISDGLVTSISVLSEVVGYPEPKIVTVLSKK